jgi:hypothetical protein
MWWMILICALSVFLIWSEVGSQDCLNRWCNNTTPSVIETDSPRQMIDKTIDTLRKQHTIVGWRRAMLVAIIVTLIVTVSILHRFPTGFQFFMVAVFIFLIVYFSSVWIQARWWGQNDSKIERQLMLLRKKV